MTIIDRAENVTLAVLLTTAGAFVAAGIVTEQAGRVVQWVGREIDKAFVGWRL